MSVNAFSPDSGLPTTIGRWTECEKITLHKSGIGGTIPTEVGTMTSLEVLDLSGNKKEDGGDGITGGIPTEIGLLGESLTTLVLNDNGMDGTYYLCSLLELVCEFCWM